MPLRRKFLFCLPGAASFGAMALQAALALAAAWYGAVHWDEGWNLCVAGIWAQYDHYGCLFNGELSTSRLSTGIVPIFLTNLGFELLGKDYLVSRVMFVLVHVAFLWAFYSLGKKLFSAPVVAIALFLLCLLPDARVNPATLAAQSFAEVLLYLFFTLGLLLIVRLVETEFFFSAALSTILASVCFSLCIVTKRLAEPFVLLSLAALPIFFLLQGKGRRAGWAGALCVTTYFLKDINLYTLVPHQFIDASADGSGTTGLASILGVTTVIGIRLRVVEYLLQFYWPHVVGVGFFLWRVLQRRETSDPLDPVRRMVLVFVAAWTAWFVLLSVDFPRYFAPAATFGTLFTAQMTLTLWSWSSARARMLGKSVRASIVLLAVLQFLIAGQHFYAFLWHGVGYRAALYRVAAFVNEHPKDSTVVETYDSQLFHLLEVPYRYPPDQLNVSQIANHVGRSGMNISYDFRQYRPDFVVVGTWSRDVFKLYSDVESKGDYALVLDAPPFKVYEASVRRGVEAADGRQN